MIEISKSSLDRKWEKKADISLMARSRKAAASWPDDRISSASRRERTPLTYAAGNHETRTTQSRLCAKVPKS
jgi:hypothetical protein